MSFLSCLEMVGYVLGGAGSLVLFIAIGRKWAAKTDAAFQHRIAWNSRVDRHELAGEAGRLFMVADQLDRSGFADKAAVLRDQALRLSSQLCAQTKRAREAKEI